MALARVDMRWVQDARGATPRKAHGVRPAGRQKDAQIVRGPALTGAEPLLAFGWMTRMCALGKTMGWPLRRTSPTVKVLTLKVFLNK